MYVYSYSYEYVYEYVRVTLYQYKNMYFAYSATGGSLVSDDELHSGRLAGAVRAEQSEQLVLPHGQTHGAQRDARLLRSAAAAAALLRAATRKPAAAAYRKLAARLVQHHWISVVLKRYIRVYSYSCGYSKFSTRVYI